jgi:hypothetical protein
MRARAASCRSRQSGCADVLGDTADGRSGSITIQTSTGDVSISGSRRRIGRRLGVRIVATGPAGRPRSLSTSGDITDAGHRQQRHRASTTPGQA